MMKNYLILLGVLLLGACGKNQKAEMDAEYNRTHVIGDGELAKNVEELLATEYTESCDQVAAPMMREMARVLDAKVGEINAFMKTIPASKYSKTVPFGNSELTEYAERNPKDEWETNHESWTGSYAIFQRIKDQPMSREWVYLNGDVRSLITNDRKRLVYFQNLDLHHDAPGKVLALKKTVDACVQDESCFQPQYSEADLALIDQVGFYRYYKNKLENKNDRETLKRFQKRLAGDYGYIGFEANPLIQVLKENGKTHLHLPLNGSEFSDEQKTQLKGYMESVWKSDAIDLLIEWKDAALDVCKILFDLQSPGTRSFVSTRTKNGVTTQTMNLFPFTSTRAIAHETGHVIGFSDHYFPTWDASTCAYHTESNPGDLMSDSHGRVTAEEWETLRQSF